MASGDLFRAFKMRFSFKKEQHVRLLEKFENEKLNDGKSKNQIVKDALEMYFDALENNSGIKEDEQVTKEFLEQFKQECKEEILKELLCILVSGRMAAPSFMMSFPMDKPGAEETPKDGVADITEMPDVMNKIMDWSEN